MEHGNGRNEGCRPGPLREVDARHPTGRDVVLTSSYGYHRSLASP
jgi:hypothetical protein